MVRKQLDHHDFLARLCHDFASGTRVRAVLGKKQSFFLHPKWRFYHEKYRFYHDKSRFKLFKHQVKWRFNLRDLHLFSPKLLVSSTNYGGYGNMVM